MQRGTTTLLDALDMFLLDCEARRLTASTRQFYRPNSPSFLAGAMSMTSRTLHDLTAHDIRRFLVHIQRRRLSSQYQHNLARAIRAFLNYCVRDELIDKSPFDKVQMPKVERKVPAALTRAERSAPSCATATRP